MEKLKTVQTMLYLGGTGFNETLTARDFLTLNGIYRCLFYFIDQVYSVRILYSEAVTS